MKKLSIIILVMPALMWAGCGNLGEDPVPSPGPNADGSITLFVNGTLYNFDWTAKYDGIQLDGYAPAKPDGTGGIFTSLGSKKGGGFSGMDSRSIYYPNKGDKAMEFSHDLRHNPVDKWIVTLFDTSPIDVSGYSQITFWAKWANAPDPYIDDFGITIFPNGTSSVTIQAETNSGYEIAKTINIIDELTERDGVWRQYTVNLDKTIADIGGGSARIPLPAGERLKKWSISVPKDAGRIYVDEIVLK